MKTSSGPNTANSITATMAMISTLNCGSFAPAKKIWLAIVPASRAPWASSTGAKAVHTFARNPRPPQRSGWVGTSFSSMRDTCQRKRAHTNNRKYQRRRMNWNNGRLTQPNHQPASDGCHLPCAVAPYQLATSTAACVRQMIITPTPYTKAIIATSATTELRRRRAEARAASNFARAASAIRPRSTNCRITGRMRWWTTSSATTSSGSAIRNRTCASTS